MAEATQRLQQDKLRVTLAFAAHTRARQVAMNHAKRRVQAEGLKISEFSHAQLKVRAEAYFADHRAELLADAAVDVERWRRKGLFGKRARDAVHITTNL
jgi:hypothetical protein